MTQQIAEAEHAKQLSLHDRLNAAGIPFYPDVIEDMCPEIQQDIAEIVMMPQSRLYSLNSDSVGLLAEALEDDSGSSQTIADFIACEPFSHIGEIFKAMALKAQLGIESTTEEDAKFTSIVTNHLLIAGKAIETVNVYYKTESTSVLWDYLQNAINALYNEFNSVGHLKKEFAEEIIREMGPYRRLQDKILLNNGK